MSDSINKVRKARYNLRKKKNQCPRCGKQLGKNYDKTICEECLEKQYKYNYGKDRIKKDEKTIAKKPGNKKTGVKKANVKKPVVKKTGVKKPIKIKGSVKNKGKKN
ncbi:MAG: hypothetical protein LBB81_06580 [Treponema sp.]|nr:hypothetical protein [Treponema sp.]